MKKALIVILAVLVVLSLVACSATQSPSSAAAQSSDAVQSSTAASQSATASEAQTSAAASEKVIKVAMSMANNDDFTTKLQDKYNQYAQEQGGIEVNILNAQGDAQKQITDVESLIQTKPDVIVIRAVDMDAVVPACEAVKTAGIPLIMDGTLPATDQYDVYVSFDQAVHGKLLGQYIQTWLDADKTREAKVGYIYGVIADVIEGRRTGIYETCPSAQELANAVCNWSADKAMSQTEDWLQSHPDMNVIACANDEMALGVIQAVNAAGKKGEIIVLGVDGTEAGQTAIRSGDLAATTYQNLDVQAKEIIKMCAGIVNGQKYDKSVDLDMVQLMTIDTIDQVLGNK